MDADKAVTATFIDAVGIRTAVFFNHLRLLFVSATSSVAPQAHLTVTVPGCVTEAPMKLIRRFLNFYVFVTRGCTGLDGQPVTVTSDLGDSAEAVIR